MWKALAEEWDATGGMNNLGSPVKVSSASRFDFIHFLGLQILYTPQQSNIPDDILRQFPSDPHKSLKKVPGYTAYLNEIEQANKNSITKTSIAQECISPTLGAFVNVWQVQRQIIVGDEHAMKVAVDVSKISEVIPSPPVAHRTRAQRKAKRLEQVATPTPASKLTSISLTKQVASLSLHTKGEDVIDDDSDDGATGPAYESSDNDDDEEEGDEDDSGEHVPTPSSYCIQMYAASDILGKLLRMCFQSEPYF